MGMQIMIEGLALAAFGFMHTVTAGAAAQAAAALRDERRGAPRRVRRALAARSTTQQLGGAEIRERQEFAFEAGAAHARPADDARGVGADAASTASTITRMLFEIRQPGVNPFQAALFSKIVPNCKKLGLLDAGDGWLREKFTEIGVIEYEDALDTEVEYALLDAVVPGPRSRERVERRSSVARLARASAADARPRRRVARGTPTAGSRSHRATRGARCTTARRTARAPPARSRSTSRDQRDLRRVGARWNIDSPANSPPIATPYIPPTSCPARRRRPAATPRCCAPTRARAAACRRRRTTRRSSRAVGPGRHSRA